MQCKVEGISHDGQGVARIQGLAVFVPGALPGEEVEIQLVEKKKQWAHARLIKVLSSVPERVIPPCPYYNRCGGCSYQHANYQLQLKMKQQVVTETLRRIGKVLIEARPVLGQENPWRYRNKVTWHGRHQKGKLQMGFFMGASHRLLPIKDCLLTSSAIGDLSRKIFHGLPTLREGQDLELIVRESSFNQELMLLASGLKRQEAQILTDKLHGQLASVYGIEKEREVLLYGNPYLEERLGNQVFRLSPQAFFQVNHEQTLQLVKTLDGMMNLQGGEAILDAYCGIGSMALGLAGKAGRVVGIEAFPVAVDDARHNAEINGHDNCRFLCGRCEDILPGLDEKFEAVILDPPRSGCRPEVIQAVTRLAPSRVVYVSCEPATLARDVAHFQEAGYLVDQIQPIDMFPQTRHIETVVRLQREHIIK